MNRIKLRTIWWLISLSMFVLAIFILVNFKPRFDISMYHLFLGLTAGALTYFLGLFIRTYLKKQLVNMWGTFTESVVISPPIEEILFRFGLLALLLGTSIQSIIIASVTWMIFHFLYEATTGLPFRYYRTFSGSLDSFLSGLIFSAIFVVSGLNLFVPWVAHVVHNLLVLSPIPFRISSKSILQLKEKVVALRSSLITLFSRFSPIYTMFRVIFIYLSKLLFINSQRTINGVRFEPLHFSFSKLLQAKSILFILLSTVITLTLFSTIVLAATQSHPLSQITPINTNLNMSSRNITNASYIFIETSLSCNGCIGTASIADNAITSSKIASGISLSGNITFDTDTLFIDSSNDRVGIGTTLLNNKVEIA